MKGSAVILLMLLLVTGCAGADAAVGTSPLPTLATLPAIPPFDDLALAARGASVYDPPGHAVAGTQFYDRGATYSDLGGGVLGLAGQGATDLGWAVYRLESSGLINETLTVELAPLGTPGLNDLWYAYPDYSSGRWRWAPPTENGTFAFPLQLDSTTASGATYIALAKVGAAAQVRKVSRTGVTGGPPPDSQALTVGPGKTYATLEDAYTAAPGTGGATILVYAQVGNAPYFEPKLQVYKPGIVFWGVGAPSGERVRLDGGSFNYAGAGSVPRAVFQFNPLADGGCVRGFEIFGAHNDSYNGAAVRINQANHVRVIDCDIHDCDMGMMSNGDASASPQTGADQWIENCLIHACGNLSDPGYNHNLYLGGTSVTLRGCQVWGSLTGHNVKSRAHYNRIEYCYIHDSANRECDLVDDATNTTLPGSDTLVLGCVIVKDPNCPGNRNVIHFGGDGGNDHNGTLNLVNNTIVTPFISPVVLLSAPSAGASFFNNIVWDRASGQQNQVVADVTAGAQISRVSGGHNWLSAGFETQVPAGFNGSTTYIGSNGDDPFSNAAASDYRLSGNIPILIDGGLGWGGLSSILPVSPPGRTAQPGDFLPCEFEGPACLRARVFVGLPDLGAFEYVP